MNKVEVNSQRCRLRTNTTSIKETGPVVYLMRRDVRANDNWSILYAQEKDRPVRVAHILEKSLPSYRLAWFYANGLNACQTDLKALDIPLDIVENVDSLRKYFDDLCPSGLIADVNTLREFDLAPVISLCDELSIPLWEVDSHNVVPVWIASDKQEDSSVSLKEKIDKKLSEFLVEIPHTTSNKEKLQSTCEFDCTKYLMSEWNKSEEPGIKFTPGSKTSNEMLSEFLKKISQFEKFHEDATKDSLSNLSPWIRFGHISKQKIAYEVKKNTTSHEKFLKEIIIHAELAENYTFYNKDYDSLKGGPAFGVESLNGHVSDERPHIYTYDELRDSKTSDKLWNAAQRQLVVEGKIHSVMRFYWAKKILEWCESPEKALEIAIKLNDTYSIDGRDPRGYAGIHSSITGLHDEACDERPIFGKVRYMDEAEFKEKFDVEKYIAQNAIA